jgi:hypothetical protein
VADGDGVFDGDGVSVIDGVTDDVGLCVGDRVLEGDWVGDTVEERDGDCVGDWVGDCVGV